MSRQSLLIDRELGNRQTEAIALSNLGISWLMVGEHTQARYNLDEGLRLASSVGYRNLEPYLLSGLSRLALWQGDDAVALAHAQAALNAAIALQDPLMEAEALVGLGNAELALGRHAAATAAFERSRVVARTIDSEEQYDAAAGLARVALAQGGVAAALVHVESLLTHLAGGGTLAGTYSPLLIQLSCHHVLVRAGDPRAAELLDTAHSELQSRAAAITDATLRHSFLDNIPEHREIIAAWAAGSGGAAGFVATPISQI